MQKCPNFIMNIWFRISKHLKGRFGSPRKWRKVCVLTISYRGSSIVEWLNLEWPWCAHYPTWNSSHSSPQMWSVFWGSHSATSRAWKPTWSWLWTDHFFEAIWTQTELRLSHCPLISFFVLYFSVLFVLWMPHLKPISLINERRLQL